MPKPNSVGCYGQLNSSIYINKQGGTHSSEMCAPCGDHDLVPSFPDNLKARHIPVCLNVMADLLSRSNQVLSLHLFATRLNHKVPLYISPIPDQNSWDIDAPNINWSSLTAYAYPPSALLHRLIQNKAIQLPDHCNSSRLARDAMVLGPSAALNRDPTSATSVTNSFQTVPQ